jgi:hypothetical protein
VHAGCIRFKSWLSDQLSCLRYFHEHRKTIYDKLWSPPLTAFLNSPFLALLPCNWIPGWFPHHSHFPIKQQK